MGKRLKESNFPKINLMNACTSDSPLSKLAWSRQCALIFIPLPHLQNAIDIDKTLI